MQCHQPWSLYTAVESNAAMSGAEADNGVKARTFQPLPQVRQPSAYAMQSDPKGPHCMGLQLLPDRTQGWPLATTHT